MAILFFYVRKPLSEFIFQRHVLLRDEVQGVTAKLRQAQEQFDEFSKKLKMIETEAAALKEQAAQDAKTMRQRLLTEARKAYTQIISDAKTSAEALFVEFRIELQKEFGLKVIDLAEKYLRERLTGDDRLRISREFSKQVERIQ